MAQSLIPSHFMARRSRAREVAFQVLYQDDLNPTVSPTAGDALLGAAAAVGRPAAVARELVAGVRRHRAGVGRLHSADRRELEPAPHGGHRSQRPAPGGFEILLADTPARVAIDEAVELAKRFGSAQSAQFVNGILDRLMQANEEPAKEKEEGKGLGIGD